MVKPSPKRPVVVVLADSDSYLKWAAGLFAKADSTLNTRIQLVRGSAHPSDEQIVSALRTTDWGPEDVAVVGVTQLAPLLEAADVVVLAVRGAMALVIGEQVLPALENRPVIVTGLPGMSIPAKRRGLVYRSYADLFIVHSIAEIEAFEKVGADTPLARRFALATLPFTSPDVAVHHNPNGPFVFATQAIVPPTANERRKLASALLEYARNYPDRDLVIKIRNAEGEAQTHADSRPVQRLMRDLAGGELPANVTIAAGAMVDALDGAAGLITISSTAALEAMEYGQPVAFISDFGIRKVNLNGVFADSGLMTRLRHLENDVRDWPIVDESWKARNYFHSLGQNTWRTRLDELLKLRAAGSLPEPVHLTRSEFDAHERAYWSATALVPAERSAAQRRAVRIERARRRFRRMRAVPGRVLQKARSFAGSAKRRVIGR